LADAYVAATGSYPAEVSVGTNTMSLFVSSKSLISAEADPQVAAFINDFDTGQRRVWPFTFTTTLS
jgi:hypothetical protein